MNTAKEGNWRTQELYGNSALSESQFISNKVTSTRYTLLTLMPKNLFEQFQRSANIWFLIVSVFQLIPFEINPVDSWTTVVPLAILISVTLSKDAYNDFYRGKEDKKDNSTDYYCWNGNKFEPVKCEKLLVGNIVLINESQKFPADIVVLGTKNERVFFLDTSGISGETDLMQKKAVSESHGLIQSLDRDYVLSKMAGIVSFEQPNNDFSKFRGKLKLTGHPRAIELYSQNLAYRGSTLYGTEWVIGIILYTGLETKTYLNISSPPRKTSRLEKKINIWVLYLLLMLLVLVIFSVLALKYWGKMTFSSTSELQSFVLFTILYNNIIPISLFVTMDMLRILQTFFIMRTFKKKVDFKTGDVNENLGQIEYLFADKTGTITEQDLKLSLCIIGNSKFQREEEEKDRSATVIEDDKPLFTRVFSECSSKLLPRVESNRTGFFSDRPSMWFYKLKQLVFKDENSLIYQYIKCMALCNNVTPEDDRFIGISSDEIALVEAAAELGVKLISRSKLFCEIDCLGVKEQFTILASLPFSSSIKKSRILIRSNNDITLFVKGSFDEMVKILDENGTEELESNEQYTSRKGLRTIVFGYKKLEESQASEFISKLDSAKNIPINSEGRIEILFQEIEKDTNYLGIGGIEDNVLPETITTLNILQKAGIKIWILSGDNESSTVTTCRKVNLFKNDVPVLSLSNLKTELHCVKNLMRYVSIYIFNDYTELIPGSRNVSVKKTPVKSLLARAGSEDSIQLNDKNEKLSLVDNVNSEQNNAEIMLSQHPLFKSIAKSEISVSAFLDKTFLPNSVNFSLSIDRQSFLTAMENDDARKLLCCLLFTANSVCFYGLLPLDKARIVKLVKENFAFRPVTMAVGDGNGDIPMIQEADVGIAVLGKDNTQARNYCDIAIQHFSQLRELLLLHGHWNYSRMSKSVLLFIYKNALLTVITFAYIWYSDYSGVSLFKSSLIVGFNIGFTSLPIIYLGVFDEDMPGKKIIEYPEIYTQGLTDLLFNWKKMIYYCLLSIIDGIILPVFIGNSFITTLNSNGYAEDQNIIGSSIYIGLVFTVLLQIGLDTYCYSIMYILSHILSVIILGAYLALISSIKLTDRDLLGTGNEIIGTPSVLIAFFIVPLIIIAIHQAFAQYSAVFHPGIYEKIAMNKDNQAFVYKHNRVEKYAGNLEKVYREASFRRGTLEKDAFELRKLSLHFNSEFIEAQYRDFYISENIRFYKIIVILLFSLLVLWTILEAFVFNASLYYNLMRTVMCLAFAIVIFSLFTEFFLENYVILVISVIGIGLLAKFGTEVAFLKPGALATGVIPAITYILFNVDWQQVTYLNGLNLSLYIISISIYYEYSTNISYSLIEKTLTILSYLILNTSITITSAVLGYYLERTSRLEYRLIRMQEFSFEKSQRILSFLLPAFVKKRVKDGIRYIAEDQGTVTVIFCDIVDFDSICAEYLPVELMSFLDSVFQKFDQLCLAIGVTKIETVGKTYMACSGLKDSEAELEPALKEVSHARRAVEMGLAMISLAQTLRLKSGFQLQLKIGINSGPVTAGVVGYHKPQFSLVGDTVNTASRMCSTIENANSIQISTECYELLENTGGLEFKSNTIEAKGKGTMHTFLVTESKNMTTQESFKPGLNHLSTFINHPSFTRTLTDSDQKKKKRGSELVGMFEMDSANQVFQRDDKELMEKVKIIDFSCGENDKQKKFRIDKTMSNRQLMFSGIVLALTTFSLLLLITLFEYIFTSLTVFSILIARAGIVLILIFIVTIQNRIYLTRLFPIIMLIIFLMMLGVTLMDLIYSTKKEKDLLALEIMYIILLLNHTGQIPLSKVTWASLSIFIPWGILAIFAADPATHAANSAFVIVFALINISAIYTIENHLRVYFNLRGIAEKEISKTDKLLTYMMPPHVLENMRQDKAITDKLTGVTLLYADIVGFTAWSSNKTPAEVVGMLSMMFTRFDKVCVVHNVYKVHTIGDCYVVMGYIGGENRDLTKECLNVVEMAKSMINIIKEVNKENGSELNMRIGIHTGEVIAGITGTNIVRYDIYGPDVLISNKMESGGMAGKINVSDVTMSLLERFSPGRFNFEFNREITAKVIDRSHKSYFIVEDGNYVLL
ncbi:hypothetical protein SteCoe_6020 [Stentor coeruleus]|uniref:P-type phospholipid transporter n=1 Tax=Stentor coeruleus TaxID=5963 RepID=A0A1R2CR40_9CILI|nr:hypothetical protein SteCoe_6020 [Stentor coeruleus]